MTTKEFEKVIFLLRARTLTKKQYKVLIEQVATPMMIKKTL